MGSPGEYRERGDFVLCRRFMHFQSSKCLQFWIKMLTRTIAMMKFGRHGSKDGVKLLSLVWCAWWLVWLFLSSHRLKVRLQYEWYMCCIIFGRNWLFRHPCPPWNEGKKPPVCWWQMGLVQMTSQEGTENNIFPDLSAVLAVLLNCPEIRLQSLL